MSDSGVSSSSNLSRPSSEESYQGYSWMQGLGHNVFFQPNSWHSNYLFNVVQTLSIFISILQLKKPRDDPVLKGVGDEGYQSSQASINSDTTYSSSDSSRFGNNSIGSLDDWNSLVSSDIDISDPLYSRWYIIYYKSVIKLSKIR